MAAPTQKEVIFVAAPLGITELDKGKYCTMNPSRQNLLQL